MEPEETSLVVAKANTPGNFLSGKYDHYYHDHVRFRFREKAPLSDIRRAMEEYYSELPDWNIYFDELSDNSPDDSILLGTICPPAENVVLRIVGIYEDNGESNIFNISLVSSQ